MTIFLDIQFFFYSNSCLLCYSTLFLFIFLIIGRSHVQLNCLERSSFKDNTWEMRGIRTSIKTVYYIIKVIKP